MKRGIVRAGGARGAREATAEVPSPVVWDAEVESAQPRKEPRARATRA
jgi:hypothetical protein